MIIVPIVMTPEQVEAQARYLAEAPRWVRVTWVAFYVLLLLATVGIVAWGAVITYSH